MKTGATVTGGDIKLDIDISAAIAAAGEAVAEAARGMCPVDTGALRDSISVSAEGGGAVCTARVSADAPYAAYVEFGTSKMGAQPFLVPALINGADAAAAAIAAAVGQA